MNKRQFIAPFIVLSGGLNDGGEGGVIGGGSGQGALIPEMLSYAEWLASDWAQDLFLDGEINEDDYALWWESSGFSQADWEQLNPDLPWEDYFG